MQELLDKLRLDYRVIRCQAAAVRRLNDRLDLLLREAASRRRLTSRQRRRRQRQVIRQVDRGQHLYAVAQRHLLANVQDAALCLAAGRRQAAMAYRYLGYEDIPAAAEAAPNVLSGQAEHERAIKFLHRLQAAAQDHAQAGYQLVQLLQGGCCHVNA